MTKKPTQRSRLSAGLLKLSKQFAKLRDRKHHDGRCIICGIKLLENEGEGGHLYSKDLMVTRYNTSNIHLECKECNKYTLMYNFASGKPLPSTSASKCQQQTIIFEEKIIERHGNDEMIRRLRKILLQNYKQKTEITENEYKNMIAFLYTYIKDGFPETKPEYGSVIAKSFGNERIHLSDNERLILMGIL